MRYNPTRYTDNGSPIGTLCQYCSNAVPTYDGGCSWSIDFEPVEGWTAVPTRMVGSKLDGISFSSYCVMECPKFIPDPPRNCPVSVDLSKEVRKESRIHRPILAKDPGRPYCKFSTTLFCSRGPDDNCAKCGWNPAIEESRKEALHEKE